MTTPTDDHTAPTRRPAPPPGEGARHLYAPTGRGAGPARPGPAAVTAVRLARRHRRQNVLVLVLASAFGVWLGATAPQASPATPSGPPPGTTTAPPAAAPASTQPAGRPPFQGRRR